MFLNIEYFDIFYIIFKVYLKVSNLNVYISEKIIIILFKVVYFSKFADV